MIIYISHSRNFDYQSELYHPIKNSSLGHKHKLIFPHEFSNEPFPTRDLLLNQKCDLVLAEVTQAATGQGIELGWADAAKIPIVCIYKTGNNISKSLKIVSKQFVEYASISDLVSQLEQLL